MFATHATSTASLVANIAGFVTDLPLEYKLTQDHYQAYIELPDNLDGLEVVVSDENGDCDTSPIH